MAVLVLSAAIPASAAATHSTTHRNPHMGSRSSDQGTFYWDAAPGRSLWAVNKWPNCRYRVYYYIDGTIPSGWVTPIINGVNAWDSSTYCGVDWARTTSSTSARVRFTSASSLCGSSGANWIAFACRTSGSSQSSQGWTVAFSSYKSFGVGSSARFDVQSIATNEMGHVMYVDHNPSWTNGTTQGNSCTWGSTSCLVTADTVAGFSNYWVSCSNCGSRRSVRRRLATTVCP